MTIQQLEQLKKTSEGLKLAVLEDIIYEVDGYDDIEDFFKDLYQNGCISGMIGSLIYYTDTHKFSEQYLDDIQDLRQELGREMGEPIAIPDDTDLLNWLAWFGYEETARRIYSELGGKKY